MTSGRTFFSVRILLAGAVFCVALAICPGLAGSAVAAPVPRILVLNSYNIGYDWSDEELKGLDTALNKAFARHELFIEHLDTKKFHDKRHFPHLADLLEAKYRDARLDLVIAMDNAALEFAARYRQRLFPGVPLVFCGINDYEPSMISGQSRITGVAEHHDFAGTLALALKLQPDTREVVVIHDYTDTGLAMRHEFAAAAARSSSVKVRFMDEMPLEQTVEKLKLLTPGSLVLTLSYTVEKGGRAFTQAEAAKLVSNASPVPVYAVHAEQLGNGVAGGKMMGGKIQGQKAAELAVRILAGEDVSTLPVVTGSISYAAFDYRVLEKFGIDPARLPADAVVINKPPPTYEVSKTAFWLAVFFTLFTTVGLIVSVSKYSPAQAPGTIPACPDQRVSGNAQKAGGDGRAVAQPG